MKSTQYKRQFNDKAYDRLDLFVPKGCKEILKQLANEHGKSLNRYAGNILLNVSDEDFDNIDIAKKYRFMIVSITPCELGYRVGLKKDYIHSHTGEPYFIAKTKAEIRKEMKNCIKSD